MYNVYYEAYGDSDDLLISLYYSNVYIRLNNDLVVSYVPTKVNKCVASEFVVVSISIIDLTACHYVNVHVALLKPDICSMNIVIYIVFSINNCTVLIKLVCSS